MNSIGLAFAYLKRRRGQALLSIVIGALGVAAAATAIVGFDAIPRAARQAWGGVDLVVGPKGSALDLVLCCALHVSEPRGLISLRAATKALATPAVRTAAPIALGDNVGGWRIVGATPAITDLYKARIESGRMWTDKLEAVVGASAAKALKLRIGAHFAGAHGLGGGGELHEKFPYTVVGILAPTGSVLDRLVLTDIQTVRYVHVEQAKAEMAERGSTDEEEEGTAGPDAVTAVLVSYRLPTAAIALPRQIDATETLSAGSPTFEIARLLGYARPVIVAASWVGLLLVAIAAAGAAIGLMATMNARARDLALLRALGASRAKLAAVAFAEASMIGVAALLGGLVLASITLVVGRQLVEDETGLMLRFEVDIGQIVLLIGGAIVAIVLAAALPALRAMHAEIEEVLQP